MYDKIEIFDVSGTGGEYGTGKPPTSVQGALRSRAETREEEETCGGERSIRRDVGVGCTEGQVMGFAGLSFRLYLHGANRLGRPAQTGSRVHRDLGRLEER